MATQRRQLADELTLEVSKSKEVRMKSKAFAERVMMHLKTVEAPTPARPDAHPYATGAYIDSIKLRRNYVRGARGLFARGPAWAIYTESPYAGFIEYGTGPDGPDTNSPWGKNTPTPEMAPFAKTAHFFNGTMD